MTHEQWNTCGQFHVMLVHLGIPSQGPLPANQERRLRLLACAACRRIGSLLDEECRAALELAERHADGHARNQELRAVWERLNQRLQASNRDDGRSSAVAAVCHACATPPGGRWALEAAGRAVALAHGEDTLPLVQEASPHYLAEYTAQADLLRELYGVTPRRKVSIPLAWYAWNQGSVRKLADVIYEAHAFERMPELGAALAAAGCDQSDILAHCRAAVGHARGCWVVDAILGKD